MNDVEEYENSLERSSPQHGSRYSALRHRIM